MGLLERAKQYRCDDLSEAFLKCEQYLDFLHAYEVITASELKQLAKRLIDIQNENKCWVFNAKGNESKSTRSSRQVKASNKRSVEGNIQRS